MSSNKKPGPGSPGLPQWRFLFDLASLHMAFVSWSQDGCSTSWHHVSIPGRKKGNEQIPFSLDGFITAYEEIFSLTCAYMSIVRAVSHGIP